jgi:hypothetical protein
VTSSTTASIQDASYRKAVKGATDGSLLQKLYAFGRISAASFVIGISPFVIPSLRLDHDRDRSGMTKRRRRALQ